VLHEQVSQLTVVSVPADTWKYISGCADVVYVEAATVSVSVTKACIRRPLTATVVSRQFDVVLLGDVAGQIGYESESSTTDSSYVPRT
jgi:hypothetical protein